MNTWEDVKGAKAKYFGFCVIFMLNEEIGHGPTNPPPAHLPVSKRLNFVKLLDNDTNHLSITIAVNRFSEQLIRQQPASPN